MKTCRHCGRPKVNRPRGLCWTCYYTPGVKELYPSTSKYARRGVGNGNRDSRLPAEPTNAEPGTEEKIRVMEARLARGESLFHPDDRRVTQHRPTRGAYCSAPCRVLMGKSGRRRGGRRVGDELYHHISEDAA